MEKALSKILRALLTLAVGGAALWMAWPQTAQSQVRLGLRGGATIDPDQVHFGFHVQAVIVPHLRFQPNVEIGVGNGLTLVAMNPELNYLFTTKGSIRPYIGGGPGANFFDRRRPFDSTRTDVGINFVFGIEAPLRPPRSFMAEIKIGVNEAPDLKLTFGVTF